MQSSIQRIGVIGLGHMGSDFAGNLIADGYQVTVYDRNEKHAAPLVARGATAAVGLGDLASCEVVLTSLPDDDALAENLLDRATWQLLCLAIPILRKPGNSS
jgi:3-hydroxyisobutyrate dehydrogenase-like beta-hydroxyacid dehydrogenase